MAAISACLDSPSQAILLYPVSALHLLLVVLAPLDSLRLCKASFDPRLMVLQSEVGSCNTRGPPCCGSKNLPPCLCLLGTSAFVTVPREAHQETSQALPFALCWLDRTQFSQDPQKEGFLRVRFRTTVPGTPLAPCCLCCDLDPAPPSPFQWHSG